MEEQLFLVAVQGSRRHSRPDTMLAGASSKKIGQHAVKRSWVGFDPLVAVLGQARLYDNAEDSACAYRPAACRGVAPRGRS